MRYMANALLVTLLSGCYLHQDVCVGDCGGEEEGESDECKAAVDFGITGTIEGDEPLPGTLRGEAEIAFLGTPGSSIGGQVAFAGDMDGDGLSDLVFPDPSYNPGEGRRRGVVYLVYGREESCPREAVSDEVLLLRGGGDARFESNMDPSVAPAGDLDGDGLDDLLVGQEHTSYGCLHRHDESDHARVYIVYGSDRLSGTHELGSLGSILRDSVPCNGRLWPAGVGDLDGDGFDDLAVTSAGGVHLFYGSPARLLSGPLDSAEATLPTSGVTAPGDLDGDGFSDLLLGESGRIRVVRGGSRWQGEIDVSEVSTTIEGGDIHSVVALGDLDADGYADFVVTESSYPERYGVFYGGPTIFDEPRSLDQADVTLQEGADWAWSSITPAGDFDDDGHADLAFGSVGMADGLGGVYLVPGDGTRWRGSIGLDDLATTYEGQERIWVKEAPSGPEAYPDRAGTSLSGGGDFDGDGVPDLVVGAPTDSLGSPLGGRVFLLRGGRRLAR